MWSWVVTVALYGVGIGFFHLVGGFSSAAKALQRWGESNGRRYGPERLDRMRRSASS
jgi:hypothetical protein